MIFMHIHFSVKLQCQVSASWFNSQTIMLPHLAQAPLVASFEALKGGSKSMVLLYLATKNWVIYLYIYIYNYYLSQMIHGAGI